MSAVILIWILLLLFSYGEFQHNRGEMALLKINDAYITYRGAARRAHLDSATKLWGRTK